VKKRVPDRQDLTQQFIGEKGGSPDDTLLASEGENYLEKSKRET